MYPKAARGGGRHVVNFPSKVAGVRFAESPRLPLLAQA